MFPEDLHVSRDEVEEYTLSALLYRVYKKN